jgi:tRNA(Ile)-lysidine synthase
MIERVVATGLLAEGRRVVVLLSGGRDSVCLLDVAVALGAEARALHVNYGLRAEADAEEALCRALCERLGVPLRVHRAGAPAGNLQAWAREVRYTEARREDGDIATGHTVSDQAETVLYRLAASPGRRALLGMAPRDGRIVRPLLAAGVTREETAAWCRGRGLEWAEDASNADERFARARVRHGLLEELRAIHPAAELNVVRTAALLREEAAVLDAAVDGVLAGEGEIAVDRLRALPPALARLVLARLLDDVLAAPDGARVAAGHGVDLVVEGGVVRAAVPGPVLLGVPGEARFGAWTVRAAPSEPDPRDGVLAVPGPFVVRARRPGDRMAPLGMGGHTLSLQDLFVDRHVPRSARATLPVVECDGEIAWVPGVATSERFRITPETTEAVALSAQP